MATRVVAGARPPSSFYDAAFRNAAAAAAPETQKTNNRPPEPSDDVAKYNLSYLDQEGTLMAALIAIRPRFAKLEKEYLDVIGGHNIVKHNRDTVSKSTGAERLAKIRYLLDNMGFKRSIMQIQLHEQMICALLRQIWGNEYDQKTDLINTLHKIVREYTDVVIQTGRRMGKSYGVALFCAAMLAVMPSFEIMVFSISKTNAEKMIELVRMMLPSELKQHATANNRTEMLFKVPGDTSDKKRSITALASSDEPPNTASRTMADEENATSWLVRSSSDSGATRYTTVTPDEATFASLKKCLKKYEPNTRHLFAGYGELSELTFNTIVFNKAPQVIISTTLALTRKANPTGTPDAQPAAAAPPPAPKGSQAGTKSRLVEVTSAAATVEPMAVDDNKAGPSVEAPVELTTGNTTSGDAMELMTGGVRDGNAMDIDTSAPAPNVQPEVIVWTQDALERVGKDDIKKTFIAQLCRLIVKHETVGSLTDIQEAVYGDGSVLVPVSDALAKTAQQIELVFNNEPAGAYMKVWEVMAKYLHTNTVPELPMGVSKRTLYKVHLKSYDSMNFYVYESVQDAEAFASAIDKACRKDDGGAASGANNGAQDARVVGPNGENDDGKSGNVNKGDTGAAGEEEDDFDKTGDTSQKKSENGTTKRKPVEKKETTIELAFAEIIRFAVAVALCNYEGVTKAAMPQMVAKMPKADYDQWDEHIREAPDNQKGLPVVYLQESLGGDRRQEIIEYYEQVVRNDGKNFVAVYPLWTFHEYNEAANARLGFQCILDLLVGASKACADLSSVLHVSAEKVTTVPAVTRNWSAVKYLGYVSTQPGNADTTKLLPVKSGVRVISYNDEKYNALEIANTAAIFESLKGALDKVFEKYQGFTKPTKPKFEGADDATRKAAYAARGQNTDPRRYFLLATAPTKKRGILANSPPQPALDPKPTVAPAPGTPTTRSPPAPSQGAASSVGPGPEPRPGLVAEVPVLSTTTVQEPPSRAAVHPEPPVFPVMIQQPPVLPQATHVLQPASHVQPSGGAASTAQTARISWDSLDDASRALLAVYLEAALMSAPVNTLRLSNEELWVHVCLPFATDLRIVENEEETLKDFTAAMIVAKKVLDPKTYDSLQYRDSLQCLLVKCNLTEDTPCMLFYRHKGIAQHVPPETLQPLVANDGYASITDKFNLNVFHLSVLVMKKPRYIYEMYDFLTTPTPLAKRARVEGYHYYCQQRTRGHVRGLTMAPVHRPAHPANTVHAMDGTDRVLSLAAPLLRTTRYDAYLVPARGLISAEKEQRLLSAVTTAGRKAPSIIAETFKKLRVEDYQRHNALRGSVAVPGTILHHKHSALAASYVALQNAGVKKMRVLIVSPASHGSPPVPTPLTAHLRQTLQSLTEALAAAWAS